MKSKLKFLLVIIYIVGISFYASDALKRGFLDFTHSVIGTADAIFAYSKQRFSEHFDQARQIAQLKEENTKLKEDSALLSAFSYELSDLLRDSNSSFEPNLKRVRALSYAQIGDHSKVWLDFKDFEPSRVYGLVSEGKTAGIVINQNERPLAILQNDPKSVFAVYLGENKIPGIAKGNGKNIEVKYIAKWLTPKIGDEVRTSGLDEMFLAGTLVGRVIELKDENIYITAVVEPAININIPAYLYVVTKG